MKFAAALISVCLVLSLAACGGDDLSVELPGDGNNTLRLDFPSGQAVEHRLPFRVSGGVPPYESSIEGCPDWVTLFPDQGILAGMAPAEDRGKTYFCTYRVTETDPGFRPQRSVSYGLVLVVGSLQPRNVWRFRTRTVEPGQGLCVRPNPGNPLNVATLPAAHGGTGTASYAVPGAPNPAEPGSLLSFDPSTRVLTYANPSPPPVLGTPNTYRYLVGTHEDGVDANNAEDALCLDIQYDASDSAEVCPDNTYIFVHLRVRDDAFFDENAEEYRCPDTAAPPPQGSLSNPVHSALAPVHARRAVDVAHGAVRDRVRGWSPGDPRLLSAFAPSIGIASPSGQSAGFDYSGSSESLSAGAELGAGFWQAGVVASFTRTELHYRAAANLAEYGYHAGEHDTEVFSLHPFAAWHIPSGGHFWASLGAGMGGLRHRDDVGFPSWSRSDAELRAHALGAAVPVAGVLSGELQAELGFESFAFEIEGGGRISSALPTLRGRDWRAGLAWSAPITGAPSVSVAYKRLTGDGPDGGQLEARGSVSVEGVFDPRLDLVGSAEGSFGLGDYEHDLWGLSGGIRFASGEERRGFGMHLDTRLESPDGGRALDPGMKGEAGYGLWSGSFLGTVRPYVGLARHSSDGSFRRALGIDLRDTPDSRVKVEISDRPGDRLRALELSVRHHF